MTQWIKAGKQVVDADEIVGLSLSNHTKHRFLNVYMRGGTYICLEDEYADNFMQWFEEQHANNIGVIYP